MSDDDQKRVRVVTAMPAPSLSDARKAEVAAVRAALVGAAQRVTAIDLVFGEPEYGWLNLALSSGNQRCEWCLSDTSDPFAVDGIDGAETEHAFQPWLERLVLGQSPALTIDMEGPWGVVLLAPMGGNNIRVSIAHNREVGLDVAIDRFEFVRSFYRQLIAFWESETLKNRWSHWCDRGEQWPIRSKIIEKAIS